MSLHRFYLPPDQCQQPALLLTGREAHHALHVLRVRPGDGASVLDGAGQEILCEIQDCARRQIRLRVVERRRRPELPCPITLLQAIPKGRLFESIIQKATELGAARIVPLLTERVVSRLDDEGMAQKTEKWRWVAIEAIKQCGSPWLPRIEAPLTPQQFLARGEEFDLPLIASLEPGSQHARRYFRAFQDTRGRLPTSACVWIGPEGDFTGDETKAITMGGALPISLGPLVLRTETATVYCLSLLSYELQAADAEVRRN
jgi:16S rRNA (uracil1498-N3)-methyltransferase